MTDCAAIQHETLNKLWHAMVEGIVKDTVVSLIQC